MKLTPVTAGICGLFCGTCPHFIKDCDGCLSDRVVEDCVNCKRGFRDCAKEHNVTRCNECKEFPCKRLDDFSKIHIVNGKHHHEHIFEDLNKMNEIGVQAWVDMQTEKNTCPKCGQLEIWYEDCCSNCGEPKK